MIDTKKDFSSTALTVLETNKNSSNIQNIVIRLSEENKLQNFDTHEIKGFISKSNLSYTEKIAVFPIEYENLTQRELLIMEYSSAENGNKLISQTSVEGIASICANVLNMALALTQFKKIFGEEEHEIREKQELFLLAFHENLHKDFGNVRQLEVKEAIRRGCNQEYSKGDYFQLTPVEFCKWIKCYLAEKNAVVLKVYHNKERQNTNETLLLPAPNIDKNFCEKILKHRELCGDGVYQEFGFINTMALWAYKFLDDKKIVEIPNELKIKAFNEEALKLRIKFLQGENTKSYSSDEIKSFLKSFNFENGNLISLKHDKNNTVFVTVVNQSKKMVFSQILMQYSLVEWQEMLKAYFL
jgi:hypothetical protein